MSRDGELSLGATGMEAGALRELRLRQHPEEVGSSPDSPSAACGRPGRRGAWMAKPQTGRGDACAVPSTHEVCPAVSGSDVGILRIHPSVQPWPNRTGRRITE